VLLRLVYLTVTNTFAVLRLLPMSDRDKDTEILVLRHQIAVLERQLGKEKVRFTPGDRVFFAALLHRLPVGAENRVTLCDLRVFIDQSAEPSGSYDLDRVARW
jgi:putative transposase